LISSYFQFTEKASRGEAANFRPGSNLNHRKG
jgi:hypothetical protein